MSAAQASTPAVASADAADRPHADLALRARPDLVVCDDCDAVHRRTSLSPGQIAHCHRCHAMLGRGHVVTVAGQLAFAMAAFVFLLIGNLSPLVTLDLRGIVLTVTLPHAILLTWQAGEPLVAILATATALVFPAMLIILRLYILSYLVMAKVPPGFRFAMRALRHATNWSMVEVFLLSALVSIVRSAGIAEAAPGAGLFGYAMLTLLLTSITASGQHGLWKLGSKLGAG